jgi:CheY-like chemotaxis protein
MATSQSRLLIVDDNRLIREMMFDLLRSEGYEVSTAHDGFDALSQLKGRLPDLIISDLGMPRMSGFEFLAIIRQRFPQIPTIVISGEPLSNESPIALIADAFFSKASYTLNQLTAIITKLVAASPIRPRPGVIGIAPNSIPRDATGDMLIKCRNCLRSFALMAKKLNSGLHKVTCPSCEASVQFQVDYLQRAFPQIQSSNGNGARSGVRA